MKLKKIVSTWLHSTDLARTKDFMTILGLAPIAENEKLIVFSYVEGGPNTAFYLYPEPLHNGAPIRKGGVLSIEVDDLASLLQHCKDNDLISQDTEIYAQDQFISFLLKDPDENLFEIIQQND